MVFNSFFFIFIFMPLVTAGWYLLNKKSATAAEWFLIAMGLWFYGSFGIWYLIILMLSVLFNYGTGILVRGKNKGILAAGIAVNLLFMCWFKYVTPALVSYAEAGELSVSTRAMSFLSVGLPIGFSFYTFSQISYLIDSFQGKIARDGFRRYVLYLTYFPKIIEGPITCYEEIAVQFRDPMKRRFDAEAFARGLSLFVFGLAKKLLIADVLAGVATFGIQSAWYLDTLAGILTMNCYALQLYYDFSGYCDMAMGISAMLGIALPLNFNAPFRAESFSEFWKRWHMTLTRFFTKYVYIPLGGSRRGTLRTAVNVMLVFLLSALWHGLGTTYLIWGLLSGAFVAAGSLWGKRKASKAVKRADADGKSQSRENSLSEKRNRIPRFIRRLKVYLLFILTLVFFAAPNTEYSLVILKNLFRPLYPGWLYRMAAKLDVPEFWVINKAVGVVTPSLQNPVLLLELLAIVVIGLVLTQRRTAVQLASELRLTGRNAVLVGILLVLCLCSMSGVSTYLYFKF